MSMSDCFLQKKENPQKKLIYSSMCNQLFDVFSTYRQFKYFLQVYAEYNIF